MTFIQSGLLVIQSQMQDNNFQKKCHSEQICQQLKYCASFNKITARGLYNYEAFLNLTPLSQM